jgi:hypothetical protein
MQVVLPLDQALMRLHTARRHLVLEIDIQRAAARPTSKLVARLAANIEETSVVLKVLQSSEREGCVAPASYANGFAATRPATDS